MSNESNISRCKFGSAFKNGNDATISKTFFCPVFIEVEPTFLLIIEEVEVLVSEVFDGLAVLARVKCGKYISIKANNIDIKNIARRLEIDDYIYMLVFVFFGLDYVGKCLLFVLSLYRLG